MPGFERSRGARLSDHRVTVALKTLLQITIPAHHIRYRGAACGVDGECQHLAVLVSIIGFIERLTQKRPDPKGEALCDQSKSRLVLLPDADDRGIRLVSEPDGRTSRASWYMPRVRREHHAAVRSTDVTGDRHPHRRPSRTPEASPFRYQS